MLKVHVIQLHYSLSDPAMEDTLYEIESMPRFAGLYLSDNFRHWKADRVNHHYRSNSRRSGD